MTDDVGLVGWLWIGVFAVGTASWAGEKGLDLQDLGLGTIDGGGNV